MRQGSGAVRPTNGLYLLPLGGYIEGGMSRTCSMCRQNEKYVLNLIRKSKVKAPIGKP